MKCSYAGCNTRLTVAVEQYSFKNYERALCFEHQRVIDMKNIEYLGEVKADNDRENIYELNREEVNNE